MKKLNHDINIFVSCHKNFYVPENKFLIPVHVGAALSGNNAFDMQPDDAGDNISELNPYYSELTAQYWAWKNVDCAYYGFFHYRRYLDFLTGNAHTYDNLSDAVLQKIGISEEVMRREIEQYDIILPRRCELKYERPEWHTLRSQYQYSDGHNISDLDSAIKIIHELYPSFDRYVKRAMRGAYTYFLNMYIMKKQYFFEYCGWLFPILERLHAGKDYTFASSYEMRTAGLIAERLLTVFMLYLRDKYKGLKVKELPVALFRDCGAPYPEPAFENKVGICMASDDNYAKHLGVALTSIAENSSENKKYDVIIFANDLSLHNRDLLTKTVAQHKNFSIRFLNTGDYISNVSLTEKCHINKSTYLRFAILDLLRNFDRIVYLDCDLVANHDIAELFDLDLGENYVAAARDSTMASWNNLKNQFGKDRCSYNRNIVGLENVFDYFCAGIMIFNVQVMRQHISTDKLFEIAASRTWAFQDQDVLNRVCRGKVTFLPIKWNYMPFNDVENAQHIAFSAPAYIFQEYLAAKSDPYIIHYAGHYQPMYVKNVHCSEVYWQYAKKSLYYEEILCEMIPPAAQLPLRLRTKIKRRLARLLPADTFPGRAARKLYHSIRK